MLILIWALAGPAVSAKLHRNASARLRAKRNVMADPPVGGVPKRASSRVGISYTRYRHSPIAAHRIAMRKLSRPQSLNELAEIAIRNAIIEGQLKFGD